MAHALQRQRLHSPLTQSRSPLSPIPPRLTPHAKSRQDLGTQRQRGGSGDCGSEGRGGSLDGHGPWMGGEGARACTWAPHARVRSGPAPSPSSCTASLFSPASRHPLSIPSHSMSALAAARGSTAALCMRRRRGEES